ncbi:MAG TPA: PadR family transcriptional regulator [Vicinamibacterales bacterium]|nr:PadR family transcriptional regulator [Vicinamibacterales bacterium]
MLFGVLQGTLDVLVLKALDHGTNHGYGVARWIRDTTDEALSIEDGALYTALHRLEKDGLLTAEWGVSETNRRCKYYSLTTRGRRVLREQTEAWRRTAQALFKVLESKPRKVPS